MTSKQALEELKMSLYNNERQAYLLLEVEHDLLILDILKKYVKVVTKETTGLNYKVIEMHPLIPEGMPHYNILKEWLDE
jgi:translation initiation factor RLI1